MNTNLTWTGGASPVIQSDASASGPIRAECLQPDFPLTVPAVPEPSETFLIIAGSLAVILFTSIFRPFKRNRR